MSFFAWVFGKSDRTKTSGRGDAGPRDNRARAPQMRDRVPLPVADAGNRSETRKAKRHARREQLYVAVRESLTRTGVLASSYKFKVLSLDQRGDTFMVMMDVDQTLGRQAEKLAEIEAIIAQTAKARYDILVTAVYWRMEAVVGAGVAPKPAGDLPRELAKDVVDTRNLPDKKPCASRYEPIQDDEVAAFKRALVAASASSQVTVDATGKSRSGPHSYTLLTGFEDTEMPESAAVPALSNTQYGDLN